MVADGLWTQRRPFGDFGDASGQRDKAEDLAFAIGQFGENWRCAGFRRGEEAYQPAGDGWSKDRFTVANGSNCAQHVIPVSAFQHLHTRAGAHRREHGLVVFEHRHYQHTDMRRFAQDLSSCLDSIGTRHLEVQQHDIRVRTCRQSDGFVTAARFTHHGEVRRRIENHPKSPAKDRVIVGDQDTDGALHRNCAYTRVPPERGASTAHEPPTSAARSRIERTPTHAQNILGKLGCASRREIAAIAARDKR